MILSKYKDFQGSKFDPLDQLQLLKEKCNNIASNLYNVNALYLDEIRKVLPQAIKSSLLSIITEQITQDVGFSTLKSRQRFQLKIDQLVSNNISLLTIEHLNELAKTTNEENKYQISNTKDEINKALKIRNDNNNSSLFNEGESINLSSIPPLENLSIVDEWKGELKTSYSIDDQYGHNESLEKKDLSNANEDHKNKEYESFVSDDLKGDAFNFKGKDLDVLQSIFALVDESNLNETDPNQNDSSHEINSCQELKNNRLLPDSPIGLYEWMISIDTALVRRLRDLSHAINTELLRSGLVNALVPLNILDAALSGQLISSKSISNILTLKLPTNNSLSSGVDIDCLLITPSDLEFDNPRLKKNRSHIKHYQNLLLSMIKQQRYWQGRSLSEEISKKWWKDTTTI